jgi:alpha-galactosidase
MNVYRIPFFLGLMLLITSCNQEIRIVHGDLEITFDKQLNTKVNNLSQDAAQLSDNFTATEYIITKRFPAEQFTRTFYAVGDIEDEIGKGKETMLTGEFVLGDAAVQKHLQITTYDDFPGSAVYDVSFVNSGKEDLYLEEWMIHGYAVNGDKPENEIWTFQGSSTSARADWILPVQPGFYQENYMGMNQSDYGGGIPVTDVWKKEGGIAIGHLAMHPLEVSLPVDYRKYSGKVHIGVSKEFDHPFRLAAGDTLTLPKTFVTVHHGDYFTPMRRYSELMQARGITFAESEPEAFESIWCGWGYERKFTMEDIISTLPKVKELGIEWAVIDDGFQIAEGDWRVDTKRFPGGADDMKKMVEAIHAHGLKAKLWWAPLAADPGSKVIEEHPDILLINEDGAPQYITWWNSYYLSPVADATLEYTLETVDMFMADWGFDGLKMDGQHMNAVPADHNWKRSIEYPEKSIEMLPEFFEKVYHRAREIKPHAVVENCPCGTCMSFYNMPYTNQTVSSDPTSSWQIRLKGKTYKAIMPHTAYYGDHVELSDNGSDFASSFGIGAVLGTKFTWPEDNPHQSQSYLLTPEKEEKWKKWFDLYHEKMLSRETYIGDLYDIGFDKPETHVISKADTLFYAFYEENWNGPIELRGLDKGKEYVAYDYVEERELGTFSGAEPHINTSFSNNLLISVYEK